MSSSEPQRRTQAQIKQFPRTSKINERYYARDNQPNWAQLAQLGYHFDDARGRRYTVAAQHSEPFENLRLRYGATPEPPQCVVNQLGGVTLWVRLPRDAPWFDQRHEGAMLLLREVRSGQRYLAKLDAHYKYSHKRRSGTVVLSGLGRTLCNMLLQEHAVTKNTGI